MEENMNTKQILAENTKRLRHLSKLSQFDFADEINMSKTVLSDIENARANPTLETIERLATAFHTTPALLLAACEDPSEMQAANFILSALDILQNLEPEHRTLVLRLFEQLVLLLKPSMDKHFK